jgi:hypothetical protein
MTRLSGLQQDVLSLYRRILREAMKKDRYEQQQLLGSKNDIDGCTTLSDENSYEQQQVRTSFLDLCGKTTKKNLKLTDSNQQATIKKSTTTAYAIIEFRKQALSVPRSDFKKIDYMIRKGDKYIKLLCMPGVKLVSGTAATTTTTTTNETTVSSTS